MRLKGIIFSLLVLLAPLALATSAYAQVDVSSGVCVETPGTGEKPAICNDIEDTGSKNIIYGKDGILTLVISVLSIVVAVIAVIVIIVEGIKLTISQGDPGKIATSRSQIIYALVGLVVAVVAQGVVRLILNRIGVS